jgi:hypothetical protein
VEQRFADPVSPKPRPDKQVFKIQSGAPKERGKRVKEKGVADRFMIEIRERDFRSGTVAEERLCEDVFSSSNLMRQSFVLPAP